jgi:hypothetical protein
MNIGDVRTPDGIGLIWVKLFFKQVPKAAIKIWINCGFYIRLNVVGPKAHFSHVITDSLFGNSDPLFTKLPGDFRGTIDLF